MSIPVIKSIGKRFNYNMENLLPIIVATAHHPIFDIELFYREYKNYHRVDDKNYICYRCFRIARPAIEIIQTLKDGKLSISFYMHDECLDMATGIK